MLGVHGLILPILMHFRMGSDFCSLCQARVGLGSSTCIRLVALDAFSQTAALSASPQGTNDSM
eukprot:5908561-Pyramimonas_sp.AAC.1